MKTAEESREEVAQILRDNITFSPQIGNYVIHGAIEKLLEWRRAYAEQFIDAAADSAEMKATHPALRDEICHGKAFYPHGWKFEIDKQSILKLKEQLK